MKGSSKGSCGSSCGCSSVGTSQIGQTSQKQSINSEKISSATIVPLGNRVLIQRAQAKTSKGGIFLPEGSKEKPREGTVLAVGPGKAREDGSISKMSVRVGDTVLFSSYSGTEVKNENDDELLIVSEEDVLGVVESK